MATLKQQIQDEITQYFDGDPYRFFVFMRSYSRWSNELGRRETWAEVVQRYVDFMRENLGDKLTDAEYEKVQNAILTQKVMPSMRLLWSAGEPARRSNIAGYNCSYVAIERLKDFADIIVISCNGCGVGFSCEKKAVEKLPTIESQRANPFTNRKSHIIDDSKEGWADALLFGLENWYTGYDVDFDFSKIRPEGARLKTFGGRASGPEPLKRLLEFARKTILNAQGRKLTSLEVHDIVCKIGDCVVSGGVRRTALISLSDLTDEEMRFAKFGEFWKENNQRQLANNSAIYEEKPDWETFQKEWKALEESGTGERGIYNRYNFNWSGRRKKEVGELTGTNPCGEINLLNREYCNLTSVVCRANDTQDDLIEKAIIATILGTYQSSLTNFPYISPEWKKNCEKERLLGVSLNGQFDCPEVRKEETLKKLKEVVLETNLYYADRMGINPSAAIGAIKPEGTCSQMLNCSSGMHPRHAQYYIRRVRITRTDPLFKMMVESGVKYDDVDEYTKVFSFPIKSPDNAILKKDITAIEQLEYWKKVKLNYTEHNPSQTVGVGKNEWDEVGKWVYDNFDIIGGLSFFPKVDSDHLYKHAPYEEIDANEYGNRVRDWPVIDFAKVVEFEINDETSGAKELACSAPDGCDII